MIANGAAAPTSTRIALVLLLGGACVLSVSMIAYLRARARADDAAARLARIRTIARSLEAAQSAVPAWASSAGATSAGASTSDGLSQRVSASLSAAGLPVATMLSLSPEIDGTRSAGGGKSGAIERRRATLVLSGPSLPQLGRWLSVWQSREPAWVVSSIELQPDQALASKAAPGTDLPLRAVVGLQSMSYRPAQGETP